MLISVEDMKEYLGIDPGDTDYDDFLEEQINVVQEAIENYTRRKFELTDYIQTFYSSDYEWNSRLELFFYPVTSISKIASDNVDITGYRVNKPSGILTYREGFHHGEELIVEYTAGYDAGEVPAIIMSTLKSIVQERYNLKASGAGINFGSDVQRISIPGAISIDFDYSLQNNDRKTDFGLILGNYINVLDFYRSERAVIGSGKLTYVEKN